MARVLERVSVSLALFLFFLQLSTPSQERRLEDAIKESPSPSALESVPMGPSLRASLREALGARDYTRAETLLVDEINQNPKSPQLLRLLGGIFFLDGKYLNTAVAMKRAEALAPLDDQSRFTLTMAYITLNHRDWARPELEKLARNDPRNALYPYWLSRLNYDAMRFTAAVANARKAISLNSRFVKAYDNLGLSYEALGKLDDAVEAYRQAVRLNRESQPGSLWPALNFGSLLIKLGRLEEAELNLKEALQSDPKLPRAHYQMGLLLEKQKKDAEAIQELRQAAALNPAYAEPYYALGKIYQRMGDRQQAEQAWSTFQKLKKEQPQEAKH